MTFQQKGEQNLDKRYRHCLKKIEDGEKNNVIKDDTYNLYCTIIKQFKFVPISNYIITS